jgi:hypothetical protein
VWKVFSAMAAIISKFVTVSNLNVTYDFSSDELAEDKSPNFKHAGLSCILSTANMAYKDLQYRQVSQG